MKSRSQVSQSWSRLGLSTLLFLTACSSGGEISSTLPPTSSEDVSLLRANFEITDANGTQVNAATVGTTLFLTSPRIASGSKIPRVVFLGGPGSEDDVEVRQVERQSPTTLKIVVPRDPVTKRNATTGQIRVFTSPLVQFTSREDFIVLASPEIIVRESGTEILDGQAAPINFGATAAGSPIQKTFTVEVPANADNTPLQLSNFTALPVPGSPSGFSFVEPLPTSIAAGTSGEFTIQLDAAVQGTFKSQVSFTNNTLAENPFNFSIEGGVSGTPNIAVAVNTCPDSTQETPEITNGQSTEVRVGFTVFQRRKEICRVTVSNPGTAPLTLTSVSLPEELNLVNTTFPVTIQPGRDADLQLEINLKGIAQIGYISGQMTIENTSGGVKNRFQFPIQAIVGVGLSTLLPNPGSSPSTVNLSAVRLPLDGSLRVPVVVDIPETDLVLLQDLSGSYRDDIEKLREVAQDITEILPGSVGYGVASFVDKPVTPFGGEGDYVYQTELGVTTNPESFLSAIAGLELGAGGDLPESQIEALLQLARRNDEIKFRSGSRRVVVLTTDADFHKAGDYTRNPVDSPSGTPVPPNNGDGSLEGGTGEKEDYPSVAQVKDALEDADISPIFLVTGEQPFQTYENLVTDLERGLVLELAENSANIVTQIRKGIETLNQVLVTNDPSNVVESINPEQLELELDPAENFLFEVNLQNPGANGIQVGVTGIGEFTLNTGL
jgi:hypothetical protein